MLYWMMASKYRLHRSNPHRCQKVDLFREFRLPGRSPSLLRPTTWTSFRQSKLENLTSLWLHLMRLYRPTMTAGRWPAVALRGLVEARRIPALPSKGEKRLLQYLLDQHHVRMENWQCTAPRQSERPDLNHLATIQSQTECLQTFAAQDLPCLLHICRTRYSKRHLSQRPRLQYRLVKTQNFFPVSPQILNQRTYGQTSSPSRTADHPRAPQPSASRAARPSHSKPHLPAPPKPPTTP